MWGKHQKMEPRAENEPKFNPQNKTDRKILMTVVISCSILILLIIGLILVYIFLM
ncbi:hypothetical protein SDC9_100120 [bioreactor metagenome]|uniref:DUF4044 domain-containing protein n=1 Tax=bioreactor metagenome TaxID=1076179 RepID=A0A645AR72_9ZZZZ|nr:hypothetical protein [Erysipelotrichaceae bacterium]